MESTSPPNFKLVISQERAYTVKLLRNLKPGQWDFDTLCAGWTIADLMAHILVRERGGPLARAGILIPALRGRTNQAMDNQKKAGHKAMIELLAKPPAWVSVVKYNLVEFFVHNEDIVRSQLKQSRELSPEIEEALSEMLPGIARLGLRAVHEPLIVDIIDETTREVIEIRRGQAGDEAPHLRLVGRPGEFILLFMGRGRQAKIAVSGDAAAKEIYRLAAIGL